MVKTTLVKRTAAKLFKLHKEEFKTDFDHNKSKIEELAELHSTKLRNGIAGLITKLVRKDKQWSHPQN